jgi:UDPglucose 6-dehydrogenase
MNTNKIGVIGLGKLGLPLAVTLSNAKFSVIGFDQQEQLVNDLNTGTYESIEPGLNELLQRNVDSKTLSFSTSLSDLEACTLFYVIVPTPSDDTGKFSSKYVESVISEIAKTFQNTSLERSVVVVSTLMPGETRRISREHLSGTKIKLLYSPEFIALGTVIQNLIHPDSILVGCEDPADAQFHLQVQRKITEGAPESILNWEEAEVVKLLVNCYVTMKISFANFIGEVSDVLTNANSLRISEALGLDSRIGRLYLRPGLGFAGPCFPRDNYALLAWARESGLMADLASATIAINDRQPQVAVNRILPILKDDQKVTLVGLVYKPNTTIMDHSQTLAIAQLLKNRGVEVEVFDPYLSALDRESIRKIFRVLDRLEESTASNVVVLSKEFMPLLYPQSNLFKKIVEL